MSLATRLAALEQRILPPEPHRHSIARLIVLEAPAPSDAALRAWEAAQPDCRCADAEHGVCVVGVAGEVKTLQETLL